MQEAALPVDRNQGASLLKPGGGAGESPKIANVGPGTTTEAPPQVGSPLRVADTATAIPGGSGDFTAFGSDQVHPIDPALSADRLAFVGSGSGGQQGVYVMAVGSPISRVTATATPIPGSSGHFASFGAVSISETDVAFLAHGAGGQTAIYDLTRGQLLKVIAVGASIGGKVITGLNFSRSGLSGDPVAFQGTFSDGSQGVYTIDVVPAPSLLRITAVSISGNELRFSFPASSGRNAIESLTDLGSDEWKAFPDSMVFTVNGTTEIVYPSGSTARSNSIEYRCSRDCGLSSPRTSS